MHGDAYRAHTYKRVGASKRINEGGIAEEFEWKPWQQKCLQCYAYRSFICPSSLFLHTRPFTTNTRTERRNSEKHHEHDSCFFFGKNYANGRKINSWARESVIRGLLFRKYFSVALSVCKCKRMRSTMLPYTHPIFLCAIVAYMRAQIPRFDDWEHRASGRVG